MKHRKFPELKVHYVRRLKNVFLEKGTLKVFVKTKADKEGRRV